MMRESDQLAALRRDDAPQRRIQNRLQRRLADWRGHSGMAALERDIGAFANGADLQQLPLLAALFDPGEGTASALVGDLTGRLIAVLAQYPLGLVPLRHSSDSHGSTLLLAQHGGATLALQVLHGTGINSRSRVQSISFAPLETWEHVLEGELHAERISIAGFNDDRALFRCDQLHLSAGDVVHRSGMHEALLPLRVKGSVVSLRLQRRGARSLPVRAYRLADGTLCRSAASDPRDSRLELAAAVLGRMGRSDAAPLLADLAREDFGDGLRWQALRECLALDAAKGFAVLSDLADRATDPLAAPARALRAQLLADHRQLAALAQDCAPCPA